MLQCEQYIIQQHKDVTHWQSKARLQQTDQQKGTFQLHDVLQCAKTWVSYQMLLLYFCQALWNINMHIYQDREALKRVLPAPLTVFLLLLPLSELLSPLLVQVPFKFSACELLQSTTNLSRQRVVSVVDISHGIRLRHSQHGAGKCVIRCKSCL